MRYSNRNLSRKKIILVDKQGELKIKRTAMHPAVLFKQQFGLIIAIWIAFFLFVAIYIGAI
jgi:hypothetical protein